MSESKSFAKIRDTAFKFRISAPQIASNRSLSLMDANILLREQAHSSELQLMFVNHSLQIVLNRQLLSLCNIFGTFVQNSLEFTNLLYSQGFVERIRLCVRRPLL